MLYIFATTIKKHNTSNLLSSVAIYNGGNIVRFITKIDWMRDGLGHATKTGPNSKYVSSR